MSICLCSHIPYIPKSFGSHLFCVNIRALVSASITCCQIRMAGHSSCQIRIVGMLIAPVINHVSHVSSSTGMFYATVWTFLRAGKLYITDWRGPSTNVIYFHYRSGLVYCCFADSTCHQSVMAASSLQELAALRNLSTCELDKRRHLMTDVRTSKPNLGK